MPGQVSAKKSLVAMLSASNAARRARGHLPGDSVFERPMRHGVAGREQGRMWGKVSPNTPPKNPHAGVTWLSGLSLVHLGPPSPAGIPAGGVGISS